MVEGGHLKGVQTRAAKGGYQIRLVSHGNELWVFEKGEMSEARG